MQSGLISRRGLAANKLVRVALLLIMCTVLGSILSLVNSKPAEASWADDIYNDVVTVAPPNIALYAANACANLGWNVYQDSWISPVGKPTATAVVVDRDTKADLQLNSISYRCKNSSAVRGNTNIVSATDAKTGATVSALQGLKYRVNYPSSPNQMITSVPKTFQFGPFTGYSADDVIKINTRGRGNILYSDRGLKCAIVQDPQVPGQADVVPNGDESSFVGDIAGSCEQSNGEFSIKVVVDTKPQLAMSATCSKVSFYVSDPDYDDYDVRLIWDDGNTSSVVSKTNGPQPSTDPNDPAAKAFNSGSFDITNRQDYSQHTYSVRVRSYGHSGDTVIQPSSRAVPGSPCIQPKCSAVTLNPSSPSVGEPFTVTASFVGLDDSGNSPAAIGAQGDALNFFGWILSGGFSGSNISPGSAPTYAQAGTINPGGTTGSLTWTMNSATAGFKTGTFHFVTGGSPNQVVDCPVTTDCNAAGGCIPVSNKPYLRAWRGDVSAGCSSAATGWPHASGWAGRILAFNSGNGKGSGGDLAVQALHRINGFSSHQQGGMTTDDYLTFANSGSGVNASWGGSFGAGACPSDYFSGAPAPTSANGNNAPISGSLSGLDGDYIFKGGTISGGTIPARTHLNVYIDGDLTITDNILLNTGATWTSVSDIPSLRLIVRGNIYIDHSVSKLEGVYVAQPSSAANAATSGIIYTCTNGAALYDETGLINNCSGADDTSLSVYGSFVARYVKLLRLKWSIDSADPANTINPATGIPAGSAAEKFIYTPETWLSAPSQSSSSGTYDAITSLPPVF